MDTISFLQHYLRINTAHPHPNYSAALTLLEKQAHKDEFTTQRIKLASQRTVLVTTLAGSDKTLPALALNHHMDVVPAHAGTFPLAFAGTIQNNMIIGRGTQDMKGIGIIHYTALRKLKQHYGIPQRTIHLLAVPDEEIGGFTGTGEFIKTTACEQLNIGFVLDEGYPSGDQNRLFIKTSERTPVQVRLTCTGQQAHGSLLMANNALHTLINALQTIVNIHQNQQNAANTIAPGLLLSANITSLTAGNDATCNTVPANATATIDFRVPPGVSMSVVFNLLEQLRHENPTLHYHVIAQADAIIAQDNMSNSNYYKALAQSIEQEGLAAQQHFFEGTTDLRFYQDRGIIGLGITPFTCTPNLHGIDEAISIDDLKRGERILFNFLINFCGEPL